MMKTNEFMFVTVLIVMCMFISSIDAEKKYIHYGDLIGNGRCNPRFPTKECYLPIQANPYTRGCSSITRCRRNPGLATFSIPPLKIFLDTVLQE